MAGPTTGGKIKGRLNNLGDWNANTNTPTLASGVGTVNGYYIVSVAGATVLDGATDWDVDDWVLFDGSVWRKIDNTGGVPDLSISTGIYSGKIWTEVAAAVASSDLVLSPTPFGGVYFGPPADGTIAGGDQRGTESVDLQLRRTASTQVASGDGTFIGSGQQNTVSAQFSSIVGGRGSTISGSGYAAVLGGFSHTVSGAYSVCVGGSQHVVGGDSTFVGGGSGNVTSSDYATIAGGFSGVADHYGEQVHASGRFSAVGDAQHSDVVWRKATTDATANVELFLNGSSERFTIASGCSYVFDIIVNARRTDVVGKAAWHFRGMVSNEAGTTAIDGVVVKTVIHNGLGAVDCQFTADNANDALKPDVTGVGGNDIQWVMHGRMIKNLGWSP